MIEGVDHIGIVVRDIEEATARYALLLGLKEESRESYGEGQMEIAFLVPMPGIRPSIELLAPLRPGSSAWEFLQTRGEGIEHVAYRVTDVAFELGRIRETMPEALEDTCARPGAGGMEIAFLRLSALFGALTELVAPRRGVGAS